MKNLTDLLGKEFSAEDDGTYVKSSMELDEGHGDYSHHVEAKDGTWQLNLDAKGIVQTIFLTSQSPTPFPYDLKPSMSPEEVENLLGPPNKSGEEHEIEFLGRYGPWYRYDKSDVCVHIQFTTGDHNLEKVTLMLPDVAP